MAAVGSQRVDLIDLLPYLVVLMLLVVVVVWLGTRQTGVRTRTLGEMLALTPNWFETFICELLRQQVHRHVCRGGGPGDLNADITGTDLQGRSVIVQCKRYTPGNRAGSPTMRTFIGMAYVHYKADRAILLPLPLIAP